MSTDETRVWTIPNVLTMVRIALILVFLWLLIAERDAWAITVLAAAAITDFLDGFIARALKQVTALGRILDPAADRLLTLAVLVGFGVRGILPWWIIALLLARDVVVLAALAWGRARRVEAPAVTWTGKTATAALFFFLPLLYLAHGRWHTVELVALGGILLGAVVYWASGIGYARTIARSAGDTGADVSTPAP